jgi:CheY-like chemotaxis protein
VVCDGEQLWEYLRQHGPYGPQDAPRPSLILLDLNMPRKDGREALREIKADPRFRPIPVVVLTTSTAPDDVGFCYTCGASSYITKPVTFREWVKLVQGLAHYWFEVVHLPEDSRQ